MSGAPERIRTSDLCLRRAALYPAELRVRLAVVAAGGRFIRARAAAAKPFAGWSLCGQIFGNHRNHLEHDGRPHHGGDVVG